MGFLAMSALLVCLQLAGVFHFGIIGLHGFEVLKYAAFWGIAFLLVGLFEEFFFSGLRSLYAEPRNQILAISAFGLRDLWPAPSQQPRRELGWRIRGWGDQPAILFPSASDGQSLDAHWISRGLGLGRNLFLRCAG